VNDDAAALARRFNDLSDAALLLRLQRGGLTETAQEIALAELAARGLSLPLPEDKPLPAAAEEDLPLPAHPVAEVQFGADEFTANPYQAPRARVKDTQRGASSWTAVFWWIYIGYIVLLIGLGTLRWTVSGMYLRDLVGPLLNAWALVGLVGWRLRRPFVHAGLWVACLAIAAAQYTFTVLSFVRVVMPNIGAALGGTLFPFAVAFLLGGLPLFWGLLRYTFFSASIWQGRVR
jgi:hypothetical protein